MHLSRKQSAFTLVEMMVATAILALMMTILIQMTNQTANTWRYGAAKSEQFQEARKAFETMTRRISEATLNTYWDYYRDPSKPRDAKGLGAAPDSYVRQSDLRFRVVQMSEGGLSTPTVFRPTQGIFFQAPVGFVDATSSETALAKLDHLLNAWGYFVEVASTSNVPSFLSAGFPPHTRSRLMEFRQPSEKFDLYTRLAAKLELEMSGGGFTTGDVPNRDPQIGGGGKAAAEDDAWFTGPLGLTVTDTNRPVRALAENIVALVLLPRLSAEDEQARREDVLHPVDPTNPVRPDRVLLSPNYTYHSKQLTNYTDTYYRAGKVDAEINPKNQLPPIIQVAMVAIDEVSAQKLAKKYPSGDLGLPDLLKGKNGAELFKDATLLETRDTNSEDDLTQLENKLIEEKLNYRIFTSNVAIRGAKWSRAQIK